MGRPSVPGATLAAVMRTVEERRRTMPERSYVATLLRTGRDAIGCKLAEEAGEVLKATREESRERQVSEVCDLLFHTMVLMAHQGITLEMVEAELARRHGVSGLDEKAARGKKTK
jgi:phosphoribosyl-ATP pyrophosphohydrolase